jgi:type I site-specific restriction endonuclease
MKITLSKSQWEFIGKKAGWMKKAQLEDLPYDLWQAIRGFYFDKYHSDARPRIEKAVNDSIENIKNNKRSFVIYGEPQSGKTEMMICLTAKLLDEKNKIIILLLNDNVELLNQNLNRFIESNLAPSPKNYTEVLDPSITIGENDWVIFCKKNSGDLKKIIDIQKFFRQQQT